jgi:hypothetical protein
MDHWVKDYMDAASKVAWVYTPYTKHNKRNTKRKIK